MLECWSCIEGHPPYIRKWLICIGHSRHSTPKIAIFASSNQANNSINSMEDKGIEKIMALFETQSKQFAMMEDMNKKLDQLLAK